MAYSPLDRWFLTGQIKNFEDLAADDFQRMAPRFQGGNFEKNRRLVDRITKIACKNDRIPSQLALAWIFARGPRIVTIRGTERIRYLRKM